MNFSTWSALNGSNAQDKTYDYGVGKNQRTGSRRGAAAGKKAKNQQKNDMWDLMKESYTPPAKTEDYRSMQVASNKAHASDVKLSGRAQKLLEELKEKYGNMDFFVGSYSTEEEAQKYLRHGTKEYSVLIDPETLESMANDSEVRKQYEDVLAGAGDKLEEVKESLGEDADQVQTLGISIDSQGKVSYFAELDKISESRNKQVEHAREKRAEEKKEARRAEARERREHSMIKADSIEDLVAQLKEALKTEEPSDSENGREEAAAAVE